MPPFEATDAGDGGADMFRLSREAERLSEIREIKKIHTSVWTYLTFIQYLLPKNTSLCIIMKEIFLQDFLKTNALEFLLNL